MLIVIPGATTKKITLNIILKETIREFKWYTRISPLNTKEDFVEEQRNRKDIKHIENRGFPGGTVVKNPPANAGDTSLSPGPGRSHMPWSN